MTLNSQKLRKLPRELIQLTSTLMATQDLTTSSRELSRPKVYQTLPLLVLTQARKEHLPRAKTLREQRVVPMNQPRWSPSTLLKWKKPWRLKSPSFVSASLRLETGLWTDSSLRDSFLLESTRSLMTGLTSPTRLRTTPLKRYAKWSRQPSRIRARSKLSWE